MIELKGRGAAVKKAYRFNPTDFAGISCLPYELEDFYSLLEQYKESGNQDILPALRNQWEELFFTLKHRELEGALDSTTTAEIQLYLEELLND